MLFIVHGNIHFVSCSDLEKMFYNAVIRFASIMHFVIIKVVRSPWVVALFTLTSKM